eukprot:TRINITY_DN1069_c0_g3_i1.p1 TRINITY_DN1069_c0_g3~~TRINITY_DN1069_c0_g3_i1.p1  ORF type:complete len:450 (+),score=84.24 TRINITY_DN1069_c0_g3_i1:98-1447(+)
MFNQKPVFFGDESFRAPKGSSTHRGKEEGEEGILVKMDGRPVRIVMQKGESRGRIGLPSTRRDVSTRLGDSILPDENTGHSFRCEAPMPTAREIGRNPLQRRDENKARPVAVNELSHRSYVLDSNASTAQLESIVDAKENRWEAFADASGVKAPPVENKGALAPRKASCVGQTNEGTNAAPPQVRSKSPLTRLKDKRCTSLARQRDASSTGLGNRTIAVKRPAKDFELEIETGEETLSTNRRDLYALPRALPKDEILFLRSPKGMNLLHFLQNQNIAAEQVSFAAPEVEGEDEYDYVKVRCPRSGAGAPLIQRISDLVKEENVAVAFKPEDRQWKRLSGLLVAEAPRPQLQPAQSMASKESNLFESHLRATRDERPVTHRREEWAPLAVGNTRTNVEHLTSKPSNAYDYSVFSYNGQPVRKPRVSLNSSGASLGPVSYTHLTLPTIYSV